MGLCPYCNHELHLLDFFRIIPQKGLLKDHITAEFLGERIIVDRYDLNTRIECKMFVCPYCQKILEFSECGH